MTARRAGARLAKVTARSITDRAYEAIRDAIVEGQFRPGERLSEETLAEQLGVSKTPCTTPSGAWWPRVWFK